MSERERVVDEEMWRVPVSTKSDGKAVTDEASEAEAGDEHAYEDSWYQVLRSKVVGES